MIGGIRDCILAICIMATTALPAHAANPTFSDLLARAQAQAAAGHRWAPPGDNMTETVMSMMDLIPTATPSEIAQLSALLERERAGVQRSRQNPPASSDGLADRTAEVPAPQSPPALATALPPLSSMASEPAGRQLDASREMTPGEAGQFGSGQLAPSRMQPDDVDPGAPGLSPMGLGDLGSSNPGSGQPAVRQPESGQTGHGQIGPGANQPVRALPAPGPRAALLFARGLDAEHRGDLSGARRFYFSAAAEGDAAAARNLGRLYDPAYLRQTALGGVDPDPALARHWYEQAVRLGDNQAGPLLEALSVR